MWSFYSNVSAQAMYGNISRSLFNILSDSWADWENWHSGQETYFFDTSLLQACLSPNTDNQTPQCQSVHLPP